MQNAMAEPGGGSGRRRRSFNQLMLSQSAVNPSPGPTPIKFNARESVDRIFITVTSDAENYVMVDLTGAKDAAFIRERIFSKVVMPFV